MTRERVVQIEEPRLPGGGSVAEDAPARRRAFLPFAPPWIGADEIDEVVRVLRSDWISTGPCTAAFERDFANVVTAPSALALNSCTAGLHTALAVLGVTAGDDVITSTLSFAACANVAEHVGARPVLVDVEPDTLTLDPSAVERAITRRTRAIMPVHYAGHPAEMDAINAVAERHGAAVVEDAAHAPAAAYHGRPIGSGPNPTAFSFYATKNLTTGEGGMLTGEPGFIDEARVLSLHGMTRDALRRYREGGSWFYEVVAPGFKYNMTDIQAAIGMWQLRKLGAFQRRRREVVAVYDAAFATEEALQIPGRRDGVEHAWHLYVLRLRTEALRIDRDRFIQELGHRNIGASVHFIPIHEHPFYRRKYGYRPRDFPVAHESFTRMVSLPLYPRMSDQDVADVVEAVRDIVREFKR
jgi:dTDP-4-amino-4,6-dideoxygalactose transaminase